MRYAASGLPRSRDRVRLARTATQAGGSLTNAPDVSLTFDDAENGRETRKDQGSATNESRGRTYSSALLLFTKASRNCANGTMFCSTLAASSAAMYSARAATGTTVHG